MQLDNLDFTSEWHSGDILSKYCRVCVAIDRSLRATSYSVARPATIDRY